MKDLSKINIQFCIIRQSNMIFQANFMEKQVFRQKNHHLYHGRQEEYLLSTKSQLIILKFQMGQKIIIDRVKDDGDSEDGINYYSDKLKEEILKLVQMSQLVKKELKRSSTDENYLSSQYYKQWQPLEPKEQIILETNSYQAVKEQQEYFGMFRQYFNKTQATYLLNLLKNTKRVPGGEKPSNGNNIKLNFKYLYGVEDDIVLFKYYILDNPLKIQKSYDNLRLICYTVEIFSKDKIPMGLRMSLEALIKKEENLIGQLNYQRKEGGQLSDLLEKFQNPGIDQLKNILLKERLLQTFEW